MSDKNQQEYAVSNQFKQTVSLLPESARAMDSLKIPVLKLIHPDLTTAESGRRSAAPIAQHQNRYNAEQLMSIKKFINEFKTPDNLNKEQTAALVALLEQCRTVVDGIAIKGELQDQEKRFEKMGTSYKNAIPEMKGDILKQMNSLIVKMDPSQRPLMNKVADSVMSAVKGVYNYLPSWASKPAEPAKIEQTSKSTASPENPVQPNWAKTKEQETKDQPKTADPGSPKSSRTG